MKSNPVCAEAGQSGTLRYKICFGVYVLPLSPLFACFYNTLELSFVSPYNHLLFLAKTSKENDIDIDFSLSIGQNLKKYSSILDHGETKQRLVVKLFKQSYTFLKEENVCYFLFLINFSILAKNITCFHGDSET